MKKGRVNAKYEEKYIKANRTFPKANTFWLLVIIVVQVVLLIVGFTYQPKPQDLIHQYYVTVEPLADGSLDIEYRLVWEALDASEELTWVEIGMANKNYTVYEASVTPNIQRYEQYVDEDYVSLELYFQESYTAGDMIEFSFKINQKNILCKDDQGYFYEFVPGWFNRIQVRDYQLTWLMEQSKDYVYRGSLDYGEYRKTTIHYDAEVFSGCRTVAYKPFDDADAYDELQEDKATIIALCCVGAALLVVPEVYIVDSYVSYGRGRGFLTGYGYHVHTYGRTNPYYVREQEKHESRSNRGRYGGGSGGGCACACACACAGGGRAGCSQKDTYSTSGWREKKL